MSANRTRVVVWGAGAWGTALSLHLHKLGYAVCLWVFERGQFQTMVDTRTNPDFLPGFDIPPGIALFSDIADLPSGADLWLSVLPAQRTGELWGQIGSACPPNALVISASKGIDIDNLVTPCTTIEKYLTGTGKRVVALSGPSFAAGLASGDPTAVVLACPDEELAKKAQRMLSGMNLRGYANADRTGVELGGAVKNVVAIACGISTGLGFGPNTQAAIITRGLREIARLGVAMGAREETFAGLSGLGDLVLTCTSSESRNRTVGFHLGQGRPLLAILNSMKMVAEGVDTTRSVAALARRLGVDMPITATMERILFDGLDPKLAIDQLLSRELKAEAT